MREVHIGYTRHIFSAANFVLPLFLFSSPHMCYVMRDRNSGKGTDGSRSSGWGNQPSYGTELLRCVPLFCHNSTQRNCFLTLVLFLDYLNS